MANLREPFDVVNLRGANLRGANLRGAILGEVRWNEETRWPTADFASEMRERSNETMLGVFLMRGGSGCSSSVHASPV
ncbi:MAG: pentapeptide repeat-containing protein [Candidatus Aminicenantales bacterium]